MENRIVVLTIAERLVLLELLGTAYGDFITLKLISKVKEQLGFSDEELEQTGFLRRVRCGSCGHTDYIPYTKPAVCPACKVEMDADGTLKWNPEATAKAFGFAYTESVVVTALLRKLNDSKQLSERHLSLYEKFVEPN